MVVSARAEEPAGSMGTPDASPIALSSFLDCKKRSRALRRTATSSLSLTCTSLLSIHLFAGIFDSVSAFVCRNFRNVGVQSSSLNSPSIASFMTLSFLQELSVSSFSSCFFQASTFRAIDGDSLPPQTSAMSSSRPAGRDSCAVCASHMSLFISLVICTISFATLADTAKPSLL